MRVVSFNANGIRSAAKKGFFDWVWGQNVDVLCIQETKAQESQLDEKQFHQADFHRYFFDAHKPGYSGVAIYTRQKPDQVHKGLGFDIADTEGRYIQADFGSLSVVSLYLPSGSSGEERQKVKFRFMELYEKILRQQALDGRQYILCGDWNIVHKEIDIKNFKSNQKSSGCLPEERAWVDMLVTQAGWVDAFRVINHEPEQYTWWSMRSRAWDKNVGWRIDYQMVTENLKSAIQHVEIYRGQKFSDHAPLIVDYNVK